MQSKDLEKIVVSVGLGKMRQRAQFEDKIVPEISRELAIITGQKPASRGAKKSIAGFKIRQGEVVGLSVTLRGKRMDDFLNRLVNITLPRIRDFRGITRRAIDTQGNLTIGIREHIVFPEVNPEQITTEFGLEVTLVSSAKNREDAEALYERIGIPFKKEEDAGKKRRRRR